MDTQLNRNLTFILTAIVLAASVTLLLHTTNFSIGLCLLTCTFIAVVLLRDYILKVDLHRRTGVLFLVSQQALALIIWVVSEDFFAQAYVLILIGEFTFYHSRNRSLIFTIVSYVCCLLSLWIFKQFPLTNKFSLLFLESSNTSPFLE